MKAVPLLVYNTSQRVLMEQGPVRRLPGFQDLQEEEWFCLHTAQEALQEFLSLHGYRVVDTPLLERTELFLRRGGEDLAARLYTFVEPGGHRVSLRPEFTAALLRFTLEAVSREPLPHRWQYAGPVLRYGPAEAGALRQFTQVGAELLGAAGSRADGEVVALASQALLSLEVRPLRLVLGDVGALSALLHQFGLSERVVLFLLGSVGDLRDGRGEQVWHRAQEVGLVRGAEAPELEEAPVGPSLRGLLPVEGPLGGRTPEEILARLVRKAQARDEPGRVERALRFLSSLVRVKGPPQEALGEAWALAQREGLSPQPLAGLEALLETLALYPLEGVEVLVDFGLARGIAYYTGVLFDLLPGDGGPSLGGGGRYDGLARALGAPEDLPAVGFAYTLERVVSASRSLRERARRRPRRVLVVPVDEGAYPAALRTAATLRLGGESVEAALSPLEPAEAVRYAQGKGIDAVVRVAPSGAMERQWVWDVAGLPETGRPQ